MSNTKSLTKIFKDAEFVSWNSQLFSAERSLTVGQKTESRRTIVVQKIVDETHLRKFLSLRVKAFRACRSYGTRLEEFFFRGGWVVPHQNARALHAELNRIAADWKDHAETQVYPHYERWVTEFASEHPSEAGSIIALAPTLAWVMRNNWFRWGSLQLNAQAVQAGASSSNLVDVPTALAEQALKEIADELYEAKLPKSERHTQGCRQMLARIRDKAAALAALHPRLQEIADVFGKMVPALPTSGYIVGFEAAMVKAVTEVVVDLEAFIANGFPPGAGSISITQASLPLSAPQTVIAATVVASTAAGVSAITPADPPASVPDPILSTLAPTQAATNAAAEDQAEQEEPAVAETADWSW